MRNGLIAILVMTLTACNQLIGEQGNDERIIEKYAVDDFDEIDIAGAFDITLIPSNSNEVILEVDENLVKYIDISVHSDRLVIDTDRRLNSRKGIKIKVPVKELKRIIASGASDIESSEPIISGDLEIVMSGAGKLDLVLDVKTIDIELSGAALVYLQGVAEKLDVNMSGAGSLEAEGFEVEDCNVHISGVGNASVNVTGSLEVEVSGMGKVDYLGNPKSVKGDVSGIGDISKSNN